MSALSTFVQAIFRVFVNAVWMSLMFPLAVIGIFVTKNGEGSLWVARKLWSPVLLWVGKARLEVEGQEHVDPKRPTIYVSNHQSTIDIPALFMALPVNLRFIAKSQLKWFPVLGWYLALAKHIFIDRSNRSRAIASLETAAERLRSGISIIVFPEGTRSDDGRVLPFKKGSFALAVKAKVAVCPVTIEGSGTVMPKNSWKVTPGTIRVRIGAPIDTSGYNDDSRDDLMRRVRDVIIARSLDMGGKGGDRETFAAAAGKEGVAVLPGK